MTHEYIQERYIYRPKDRLYLVFLMTRIISKGPYTMHLQLNDFLRLLK